ncbi:hypothetical protein J2X20_002774 [Pelomonas saccharophila]|uniref:KAP NTPase domain-containing protein n=1 Tax=Roseateles saccharophilus TaxID=304 RepID=A0ABU1YQ89_ROSSA|nr:P-loop NTPase fold protein [Roseateles saccharophilus]MDR7270116.1 hypothetical protein [Roseateles saccharophilus]
MIQKNGLQHWAAPKEAPTGAGGRSMSKAKNQAIRMPELLVFGRSLLLGAALTEIFWVAFLSTRAFAERLVDEWVASLGIPLFLVVIFLVGFYGYKRGTKDHLAKVVRSGRVDLLLMLVLGAWATFLLAPQLEKFHAVVLQAPWQWAPTFLTMALVLFGSSLRQRSGRALTSNTPSYFLADTEIDEPTQDALGVSQNAEQFADLVLANGTHAGLVFGLDGPWGIGKTSFINLAEARWKEKAADSVIVFKFQPLRYASEPDLSERFIKELCKAIQQKVFAPEFLPAANRYSRMLKGKTDVSILGIKLTFEPSEETVDELLENIDDVLQQAGRRLIVVIDDLDRLDSKLVNNVLFTARRTFRLRHAHYVLCYDTEMLVAGKEEGGRAREFLEKFINVKLSLFIDGQTIEKFLKSDWMVQQERLRIMPADTIDRMSAVMTTVAGLMAGESADQYMPLLGDLRKIKRFVNAMLMMRITEADLDGGDFHYPDLINLMLLHLLYPGLFRRIYAEETEGRAGTFSLRWTDDAETAFHANHDDFGEVVQSLEKPAQFLVNQLFDRNTLGFSKASRPNELAYRTRACFNTDSRNLQNYLSLIVRFVVPEKAETYRLYIDAVNQIIEGTTTTPEVLARDEFNLRRGDKTHDKFWQTLLSNARLLSRKDADQAIDTLLSYLPRYASHELGDNGLRQRSVTLLILLLDRAGYGEPQDGGVRDSELQVEIAKRILDANPASYGESLVDVMTKTDRGALGYEDLLTFRLRCCMDRGGQTQSLFSALLLYDNPTATTGGEVTELTVRSMRRLSQEVFKRFRRDYIDRKLNFFQEVDKLEDDAIFGDAGVPADLTPLEAKQAAEVARSSIKTFVVHQLTNDEQPHGLGVGCGLYDPVGEMDAGRIRVEMVNYLLDFCFNPMLENIANARAFGDFCLSSLRESRVSAPGATDSDLAKAALTRLLPVEELRGFWIKHGPKLKNLLTNEKRTVLTYKFEAKYEYWIPIFRDVLDEMVK